MSRTSSIIVVGAGIVGVHTAWYLQQAGFTVTLVDHNTAPAQETSFANGSQLSYGHVEPWASKDTYPQIFRALWDETSPILFRLRWDLAQWRWAFSFLREGTTQRYHHNLKQLLKLAMRSREAHLELQQTLHIDYAEQNKGIIHLYATQEAYRLGIHHAEVINDLGYARYPLSVSELFHLEPALEHSPTPIFGATYCPQDASGDARAWAQALCQDFITKGGKFLTQSTVQSFVRGRGRIQGIVLENQEQLEAGRVILCTGIRTISLIKPLGLSVSIYPVKGYSITLPITDPSVIPHISLTDDQGKIVMSRLGNYLRVAGTAEFIGWDDTLNNKRVDSLVRRCQAYFPKGLDFSQLNAWTGLRPVTPSGYPYIGESKLPGLYFNTGHGTLGWTLSAGSAKIITEQILREPL
ncbi:MAG: FAD-dependent oxidoreductase [Ferrovum sp. 37-45-19]|jgi:D-amino-acid dehydrogenase|uniref:D-amino acid dehydrogenase n=1 Tax=Ferrovum sp. JA12 TaxID=1356299 RepID=UPI0007027A00|nr:D-amino acid dehydrogenase [Ferrovum sp. JA12]OYV80719.1 MAG: FAD-dependent oxidoreductase [Ferrovum sp. 21-44-67]OYV95271.1 MAG: FAD-dependent oxidoreductase [Ferrovum sp. 37-45-19]OZB33710.1 MAG: FAD-dependent oxidoreductase [Ferrovum sp. 34-44-207]HQT80778.1 D-amino acid dehydrogenase [Ferrovaceae bacterium]KRH79872.1 D-amino acid dehydrogenase small subunit [Ferrovum sp. JA12]